MNNNIRFDETRVANDMMFSAKVGFAAKSLNVSRTEIYCITEHEGSLTDLRDRHLQMLRKKINFKYYHYACRQMGRKNKKLLGWSWKHDIWQMIWWLEVKWYELKHGKL